MEFNLKQHVDTFGNTSESFSPQSSHALCHRFQLSQNTASGFESTKLTITVYNTGYLCCVPSQITLPQEN